MMRRLGMVVDSYKAEARNGIQRFLCVHVGRAKEMKNEKWNMWAIRTRCA